MRKRNLRQCQNCYRWREDMFFGLPQSTACLDCVEQVARSARRRRRVSADERSNPSMRRILSVMLIVGLLMSLALSHLRDQARLEGELRYAREAYSQLLGEQIALRERIESLATTVEWSSDEIASLVDALDDLAFVVEQRQFEILRVLVPNG